MFKELNHSVIKSACSCTFERTALTPTGDIHSIDRSCFQVTNVPVRILLIEVYSLELWNVKFIIFSSEDRPSQADGLGT